MAKKQQVEQDAEPREKEAEYRYRFSYGPAEFAVTQKGHTVALRYGDIVPEVRVRPMRLRHRKGTVKALLAGWGPPPIPVIAWVEFELPVTIANPDVRDPQPPRRFWPADELEVIP